MKKPICPNCLKPPKFKFFERRMMIGNTAKPCNNCRALLKPLKWEVWAAFMLVILLIVLPRYMFEQAGLEVAIFSFLVLAVIYHLMFEWLPLKIKS